MDLTPVFVMAVIFGSVVMLVYLNIRKKERMLLIEKGADASIFTPKAVTTSPSLKWGILLTGLAIGLLIGNLLDIHAGMPQEVAYFSMLFLFGGIGLITYYVIERKKL
jgi:hypothetical protein